MTCELRLDNDAQRCETNFNHRRRPQQACSNIDVLSRTAPSSLNSIQRTDDVGWFAEEAKSMVLDRHMLCLYFLLATRRLSTRIQVNRGHHRSYCRATIICPTRGLTSCLNVQRKLACSSTSCVPIRSATRSSSWYRSSFAARSPRMSIRCPLTSGRRTWWIGSTPKPDGIRQCNFRADTAVDGDDRRSHLISRIERV